MVGLLLRYLLILCLCAQTTFASKDLKDDKYAQATRPPLPPEPKTVTPSAAQEREATPEDIVVNIIALEQQRNKSTNDLIAALARHYRALELAEFWKELKPGETLQSWFTKLLKQPSINLGKHAQAIFKQARDLKRNPDLKTKEVIAQQQYIQPQKGLVITTTEGQRIRMEPGRDLKDQKAQ